jgi:hypothetical protein
MKVVCSGLTRSENRNEKARRTDNNVELPGRGNRFPILNFERRPRADLVLRHVVFRPMAATEEMNAPINNDMARITACSEFAD